MLAGYPQHTLEKHPDIVSSALQPRSSLNSLRSYFNCKASPNERQRLHVACLALYGRCTQGSGSAFILCDPTLSKRHLRTAFSVPNCKTSPSERQRLHVACLAWYGRCTQGCVQTATQFGFHGSAREVLGHPEAA